MGRRWGCKVVAARLLDPALGTAKWKTVYDDLNDFILMERNCAQKIDIHTVSHWTVMGLDVEFSWADVCQLT